MSTLSCAQMFSYYRFVGLSDKKFATDTVLINFNGSEVALNWLIYPEFF